MRYLKNKNIKSNSLQKKKWCLLTRRGKMENWSNKDFFFS
jgi:hypothetical protein